jgi:hypothetical protein
LSAQLAGVAGALADRHRQLAAICRKTLDGAADDAVAPSLELLARAFAQLPLERPGANPYAQLLLGLRQVVPEPLQARVLSALRPLLVTTFAYGVPSDQALDVLAAYGELLEIGAGGGYWARCLQLRGARVIAFDRLAPAQQRRKAGNLVQHHPVFIGGPAEALAAVPEAATLLLVWPPGVSNRAEVDAGAPARFSSMGVHALDRFTGPDLLFVADHTSSFGSPAFFARLEREFTLTRTLPLPNLGRWRDAVHLYRRR